MRLDNKVIVVNGGTKGLGKAFAMAALKEGAYVVIAGRDEEAAAEIINEVEKKERILFVRADVCKESECKKIFDQTIKAYGKVDGLYNYTGITPVTYLTTTDERVYDRIFAVNVKGTYFCSKYAVASMMENKNGGSIVITGSTHAYSGEIDRAAYACSKGALRTLSQHIANNYAVHHIRSNFISMGWVATPGELALRESQGHDAAWLADTAARTIPLGRLLNYDDFIPGLIYLFSDDSEMVTGTELHIDGGNKT